MDTEQPSFIPPRPSAPSGERAVPAARLPAATVEHLHRLTGGDGRVEEMVLRFIADRYGAGNLFYLPPRVAKEIIKRPADFLTAVKKHCEPELKL